MGRLTTHVLDTANGRPAAGLPISLYEVKGMSIKLLKAIKTNSDGRCDEPLLENDKFVSGTYELHFGVAAYFERLGTTQASPAFLDVIPIRFTVADASSHYHVPLLVSPWSYSTYRGS